MLNGGSGENGREDLAADMDRGKKSYQHSESLDFETRFRQQRCSAVPIGAKFTPSHSARWVNLAPIGTNLASGIK
jgi:hypothetical protein